MILIKNGYLIDPKSDKEGSFDVLTSGAKIVKIAKNIDAPDDCKVIDASGKVVAPGLVDVHVHFRDPGFTQKEDIETGARAAAKGGFTSVVLMANTRPTVDNPDTLKYIIEKGSKTGINVYTCANVTLGMKGEKLVDMDEMAALGAVGFTDDGVPIMDEELVYEAMKKTAKLDMPISFHEEDPSLISNNGVNRGVASKYYNIGGSPREAEISLVERDLKLAERTGANVDIQHISAKETVELIRNAKKNGVNVHAEATPHHFTLTEEDVIKYGTLAKMNPPLRTNEDKEAIIAGLVDGTIDIIATDHAPHTVEEKQKAITEAPSGIIGLETALALGVTKLVSGGYMSMKELIRKMSTNPAQMYHLDAGHLSEGGPADIILIDTRSTWTVDKFESKACNSPFIGWELLGEVTDTICNGKIVYSKNL